MSLEVDSACGASLSMSLNASPKKVLVFTDTRTSKLYDELLADMILRLIEREARPHPNLTPGTSLLSAPSPHASLPSRSATAWHCVV